MITLPLLASERLVLMSVPGATLEATFECDDGHNFLSPNTKPEMTPLITIGGPLSRER